MNKKEWATKGERSEVVRHDDNLKMEGKFESRHAEKWAAGERAEVVRREDNLHMEGKFEGRHSEKWAPGERAHVVKHPDNIKHFKRLFGSK